MNKREKAIVEEWQRNVWPAGTKEIMSNIPDYTNVVKPRTSTTTITVTAPSEESFQLVVNYYSYKKCFIVYNAAIQNFLHPGDEWKITFGKAVKDRLAGSIDENAIIPVFKDVRRGGANSVELVLIVGMEALSDFCKSYKEWIKPDVSLIPDGKTLLYADAGGKIQFLKKNGKLYSQGRIK